MKPKLVVILGPTAVGKSDVAIELALKVDAEIINADSQQVYRFMNVGTGKPDPKQRRQVPHHLIDIINPDQEFNAALFREKSLECVQEIRSRGKNVVVCGGTGLYIRALTHGLFVGPGRKIEVRERLEQELERRGLSALFTRLKNIDPEAARRIHPNDRQRIIRSLEVFETTGKRMSEWQAEHGFRENAFRVLKIGLNRDRADLYTRINERCEQMVDRGLLQEVKSLLERGYGPDLNSLRSVGYRHMVLYLTGEKSWDEALPLMKRDTRRLAKRQLTWFRADRDILWFHPDENRAAIVKGASDFLLMG
ncbi:MAG: tRNA (adenosine(37)-N6)-dimethylallyltransferase MiaA [Deltaproteobacteria bacterium]|nr:tRNA (adenosine(37)-N6)-dimethylallyltransferase MiaA [Deltaproteobacteria bacterium]